MMRQGPDAITLLQDKHPNAHVWFGDHDSFDHFALMLEQPQWTVLEDSGCWTFYEDVGDGGNIRAYASDGVSLLPHDITYVDKERELGRMFVKTNLLAASNNVIVIRLLDSSTTKLGVTDTNGRNAVWADYATITTRSTIFSMSASVHWMIPNGDTQQGFLSYANGTRNANRATIAYDNNPDFLAWWNSTNGWVYSDVNPTVYDTFRISGVHNGTTGRKLFVDGVKKVDATPVSARPVGTGTSAQFYVNGSRTNNEVGEGLYQHIWLRHEAMSDAWMAADAANMNNSSGFYSITKNM